jgi:hypothetical protein
MDSGEPDNVGPQTAELMFLDGLELVDDIVDETVEESNNWVGSMVVGWSGCGIDVEDAVTVIGGF